MKAADHTYHNVTCVSSMSYLESLFWELPENRVQTLSAEGFSNFENIKLCILRMQMDKSGSTSFISPSISANRCCNDSSWDLRNATCAELTGNRDTELRACQDCRKNGWILSVYHISNSNVWNQMHVCLYNKFYVDVLQTGESLLLTPLTQNMKPITVTRLLLQFAKPLLQGTLCRSDLRHGTGTGHNSW